MRQGRPGWKVEAKCLRRRARASSRAGLRRNRDFMTATPMWLRRLSGRSRKGLAQRFRIPGTTCKVQDFQNREYLKCWSLRRAAYRNSQSSNFGVEDASSTSSVEEVAQNWLVICHVGYSRTGLCRVAE